MEKTNVYKCLIPNPKTLDKPLIGFAIKKTEVTWIVKTIYGNYEMKYNPKKIMDPNNDINNIWLDRKWQIENVANWHTNVIKWETIFN